MSGSEYGLLIDYSWCTGCHSCEMACSVEHDIPIGQYGIRVDQFGPWEKRRTNGPSSSCPSPPISAIFAQNALRRAKIPHAYITASPNAWNTVGWKTLPKSL